MNSKRPPFFETVVPLVEPVVVVTVWVETVGVSVVVGIPVVIEVVIIALEIATVGIVVSVYIDILVLTLQARFVVERRIDFAFHGFGVLQFPLGNDA